METATDIKDSFRIDVVDKTESGIDWRDAELEYFLGRLPNGYGRISIRECFEWDEFYPHEFSEYYKRGLGTLAHIETLLLAIDGVKLDQNIRVVHTSPSPEREGHLDAMGLENRMPMVLYLQKSIDFARRKFGWRYENPY